MFTAANFPGSVAGDRNNAKALYALLTGRVSSITGTGRLNEAGDAVRLQRPALPRGNAGRLLVLRAGRVALEADGDDHGSALRYQYTLPMIVEERRLHDDHRGRLPAARRAWAGRIGRRRDGPVLQHVQAGLPAEPRRVTPEYILYTARTPRATTRTSTTWGRTSAFAWRPNVQNGWLRTLLGDPELATINGGFTRSFVRDASRPVPERLQRQPGPDDSGDAQHARPRRSRSCCRANRWPILFSQKNRLGAPAFNHDAGVPARRRRSANGAWIFNPNIEVPWTDSWNVSFQRALTKDTVVEIRYQGNRSYKAWTLENWNAINVYENGLAERRVRTRRRRTCARTCWRAAGRRVPLHGPGTGTSPLPITLAHFNGRTDADEPGGTYTGNLWTNTTFTGALDPYFPNPYGFAGNLYARHQHGGAGGPAARGCSTTRWRWAIPSNFWVMNPQLHERERGQRTRRTCR